MYPRINISSMGLANSFISNRNKFSSFAIKLMEQSENIYEL